MLQITVSPNPPLKASPVLIPLTAEILASGLEDGADNHDDAANGNRDLTAKVIGQVRTVREGRLASRRTIAMKCLVLL